MFLPKGPTAASFDLVDGVFALQQRIDVNSRSFKLNFVASAHAASAVQGVIWDVANAPLLEAGLLRSFPGAAAVVAGGAVLHNTATFVARHPWLDEDFHELLSNPGIPQSTKQQLLAQMQRDPLFGNSSKALALMDIDPNASKPTVLSTPLVERKPLLEILPDQADILIAFGKLPGFETHKPDDFLRLPGFDIHESSWQDFVLFKKQDPEEIKQRDVLKKFSECEKEESPFWDSLKPFKTIGKKDIRTNGLKGKKLEYYHWDNMHKEIEVYKESKGWLIPHRAISPVYGRDKEKNVSKHKPIKF
jgi:hypothetical protein